MKIISFIITILLVLTIQNLQAQSPVESLQLFIEVERDENNPALFSESILLGTEVLDISTQTMIPSVIVHLSTTTDLAALQLKLGSTEGAEDYLAHTFLFDETEGLPEGMQYKREENTIYLALGKHVGIAACHASVVLEYLDGSTSQAVVVNNQN